MSAAAAPPRPRLSGPAVVRDAARRLAIPCTAWIEAAGGEASPIETLAADLARFASTGANGYEIARNLDLHCGWRPDARLVEILDETFDILCDVHEAQIREWVAANGLTLDLAPGTRVVCRHGTGTIVQHLPDLLRYLVNIDGTWRPPGYIGTHADAEDCRVLADAQAVAS